MLSADAKVKKSCPLIQEAWTTYLERDLDETNLDILAASWYLIKQDLEKVAESDNQFEKYVKGADAALSGNYTSEDLIDLLAFCDIASQG